MFEYFIRIRMIVEYLKNMILSILYIYSKKKYTTSSQHEETY